MTKPIAFDIAEFIEDDDFSLGQNLFVGRDPMNITEDTITIFDYDGGASEAKTNLDRGKIQVRSRSTDYETAFINIFNIKKKIENMGVEIINDSSYHTVINTITPYNLGYEQEDYAIWVASFEIFRSLSESDKGFRV